MVLCAAVAALAALRAAVQGSGKAKHGEVRAWLIEAYGRKRSSDRAELHFQLARVLSPACHARIVSTSLKRTAHARPDSPARPEP